MCECDNNGEVPGINPWSLSAEDAKLIEMAGSTEGQTKLLLVRLMMEVANTFGSRRMDRIIGMLRAVAGSNRNPESFDLDALTK